MSGNDRATRQPQQRLRCSREGGDDFGDMVKVNGLPAAPVKAGPGRGRLAAQSGAGVAGMVNALASRRGKCLGERSGTWLRHCYKM